jgi:hypothetical protein
MDWSLRRKGWIAGRVCAKNDMVSPFALCLLATPLLPQVNSVASKLHYWNLSRCREREIDCHTRGCLASSIVPV